VLQGAAHRLITNTSPSAATDAAHAATTSGSSGDADFVTQLRRATTRVIRDTLGDARLRELRAEGEAMDYDQAVAYALSHVEQCLNPANH
jgi:hypothetical protein